MLKSGHLFENVFFHFSREDGKMTIFSPLKKKYAVIFVSSHILVSLSDILPNLPFCSPDAPVSLGDLCLLLFVSLAVNSYRSAVPSVLQPDLTSLQF